MAYELGTGVWVEVDFENDGHIAEDPVTVELVYEAPDGTITVIAMGDLDNPSVGHWEYKISAVGQVGQWNYTWSGVDTSGDEKTKSGFFLVEEDFITPDAPARRPCENWSDVISCPSDDFDNVTVDRALAIATEVVWAASARRFGYCVATVRPCKKSSCDAVDAWPWWGTPVAAGLPWPGTWAFDPWCSVCRSKGCSCSTLEVLRLPRGPVNEIIEVKQDGEILDPSAYRTDGRRDLIRVDGESWPSCQNLNAADTEDDTLSVTYRYGSRPPEAGIYAVESYACELAKAMTGGDCALPKRITTLSRRGVNIAFMDPQEFLDKGLTGLYEVDTFIRGYNPNGLAHRSRMYRVG